MYLVFDTETNGLPKNYNGSMKDLDNWPRITQLAWGVYDEGGILLSSRRDLIIPNHWTIPTVEELTKQGNKNPNFFEENNMSTKRCSNEGIAILEALKAFAKAYNSCKFMIAHNMNFDHNILGAELLRAIRADPYCADKIKMEIKIPKLCTMLSSVDLCQLPGPYGFKWPKLEELHRFLFNEDFDGAHDAGFDVEACSRCFFELTKRGIIDLSKFDVKTQS